MAASTTLTPAQRTERARKAAAARHSLESYAKAVAAGLAKGAELSPETVAALRAVLTEGRR